jgi:hypothetical protein
MKTLNKEIDAQKSIANGVLERLSVVDPSCILAGGAPRDWYFGETASDLDFFVYLRGDLSWGSLNKQLKRALPDVKFSERDFRKEVPELYKKNPHLRAVLDFEQQGQACQLIVMNKPTFQCVVDHFPLSICKVWYKFGSIYTTEDFRAGEFGKAIVLCNDLYADGSKYVAKIRKKFPHYKYYDSWNKLAHQIMRGSL